MNILYLVSCNYTIIFRQLYNLMQWVTSFFTIFSMWTIHTWRASPQRCSNSQTLKWWWTISCDCGEGPEYYKWSHTLFPVHFSSDIMTIQRKRAIDECMHVSIYFTYHVCTYLKLIFTLTWWPKNPPLHSWCLLQYHRSGNFQVVKFSCLITYFVKKIFS